jgi:hypothetical protein
MYYARSAAELKPDVVVVVEAMAVGLDEAESRFRACATHIIFV